MLATFTSKLKHAFMHTLQSRSRDKAERQCAQKYTSRSKRISCKGIGGGKKEKSALMCTDFRLEASNGNALLKRQESLCYLGNHILISFLLYLSCYCATGGRKPAFQMKTHLRQSFTNEINQRLLSLEFVF